MLNLMVHLSAAVFAALADPVRLDIVARLAAADAPVSELAGRYPISLQAVRKHLAVLESAGLVRSEKHGRVRICRLDPEPLQAAMHWLKDREQLWRGRLDALADVVEGSNP
jgi:DNA-binding transcriptional ArsR family regulator